jgi:hypothetical protein
VTTPNVEYNVRWETLPAGRVRHPDHRFEWTREEFRGWARTVAERHGYAVEFRPVGPDDPEVGPPTQLALFRLGSETSTETGTETGTETSTETGTETTPETSTTTAKETAA